ncbi:MAG TPA: hypothetical protein PKJ99_11840 [Thermoanaerobaculales bacterium]|nr:hypothetical protein [Thermoanaerobaculales bacterium]HPA79555.1 hypothetical protein [Thermoanaerobaculales bacterium]HQL31497.1 hypothetical protein [Thermoanaerobaculales bacterium]HQN95362.1 hypothetical protein [Thermoanaerobaculales bacterium]HQP42168.1 hypothetical protein [Thermoanaerobaculales bacterium]
MIAMHRTLAVVVLTGALGACTSTTPDKPASTTGPFEQADYAVAVADLEQQVRRLPSVDSDPDLVLRLALARAVDGHIGHDTDRARELLRDLARTSSLRGEAAALLRVLDALDAAERRLAIAEPQAARAIEVQLDLIELVTAYLEGTAELRAAIDARDGSIRELKRRLRAVEDEAARLARELAELKSIDLSHPD